MRFTRQFWTVTALGALFALLAVIADHPLALLGTVGIGAWLTGTAWSATKRFHTTVDNLRVEYTIDAATTQIDSTVTTTLKVTRPVSAANTALRVTPTFPPGMTVASDVNTTLTLSIDDTTAEVVIPVTPTVAGQFSLPAPQITLTDAFGLYRETIGADPKPEVTVLPETPTLHIGKSGEAYGNAFGEHETDQPGPGIAMRELRQYTTGEDAMNIDWKSTARLGEPYVRETEGETDRHTVLLVDHRERTGSGDQSLTPLEYIREAALGLTAGAIQTTDPVSLWAVGDTAITTTVAAGSDPTTYNRVRNTLLSLTPTETASGHRVQHRLRNTQLQASTRDDTAFNRVLQAYMPRSNVVETIRDDAFIDAVHRARSQAGNGAWFVLFTTDHDPDRLRESVKIATKGGGEVLVFVVPTTLFETPDIDSVTETYTAYSEFEKLRRELDNHPRVTALELAPGDRLRALLAANESDRREARAHS